MYLRVSGLSATDVKSAIDEVADELAEVSISYDRTEKVVGVWQDGKPLYEKTINWEGTITTSSQEIATNITNPKFVFFDTVILNDNSFNTMCFPYVSTNANINGYILANGAKMHIDVGTYWNTHKLYFAFKLRYTKTTD